MGQLGNLPASGSFHAGAAHTPERVVEPGHAEGQRAGEPAVAANAAQIRQAVKPDPKSASLLETAADISKSLGIVLGYGLAVTVAISLLPESLLLALIVSLKSQAKAKEDPQAPESTDTDQGETDSLETDETPDTSGGAARAPLRVTDYEITDDGGTTTPSPTIVPLPPEHSQDTEDPPPAKEGDAHDEEDAGGIPVGPGRASVQQPEESITTALRKEDNSSSSLHQENAAGRQAGQPPDPDTVEV